MIATIEQRDSQVRGAEASGGGKAAETAADDENMGDGRHAMLDELLIGSV